MVRRVLLNLEAPDYIMAELTKEYPSLTFTAVKRDSPQLYNYLKDTEVFLSFQCKKEILAKAPQLRFIQLLRVGMDGAPLKEIFDRGITLANAKGIHKHIMSEYAIGAMINLSRNWHLVYKNQLQGKWDRGVPQGEIRGATLGILGLGSIGQEISSKAKLFGMKVLALKNKLEPMENVDKIYGPEQMAELFRLSDYIINLLPLTQETQGLINKEYFNIMKPTAYFINIGRGATVNEEDLVQALKEKQIQGAVLDVFTQEPLPADHPLWQLDNVIISPHFSGSSSKYLDKVMPIIKHNLDKYLEGKTDQMLNLVEANKGY
jgi:phosphoglycerate dehydrogenase-like enzyme